MSIGIRPSDGAENREYGMAKKACVIGLLGLGLLLAPLVLRTRDLVTEALDDFPQPTVRVAYFSPAKLRAIPNYEVLWEQFPGPRLRELESPLAKLGIRETDVDEFVLGWSPGSQESGFYGLAGGRFDAKEIAGSADAHGFATSQAAGHPAFCMSRQSDAPCVVILGKSRAAFGSLASVNAMMRARDGAFLGLASNESFPKLVAQARTRGPIWGMAVGPGVLDWFESWTASQMGLQEHWRGSSRELRGSRTPWRRLTTFT